MTNDRGEKLAGIAERKRALEEEERREGDLSFWRGMAMIGAIGWMIALPTIGGAALGWWIQHTFEIESPWSVFLMLVGLGTGCYAAWREVDKP